MKILLVINLFCSQTRLLHFLIAVQVSAVPSLLSKTYPVWEILHFEDSIKHGTYPNFSEIQESQIQNHLVYDQVDLFGAKLLQSSPGCPEYVITFIQLLLF